MSIAFRTTHLKRVFIYLFIYLVRTFANFYLIYMYMQILHSVIYCVFMSPNSYFAELFDSIVSKYLW